MPSAAAGPLPPASLDPYACVHEAMADAGWSDGLPLVPPTSARVLRMLTGTARMPSEALGQCAPMYCEVTCGHVAAAAVMAGCEPRQLRIVLAAC